jgi:glycosyltransferase involved in cell wall biosynthesis
MACGCPVVSTRCGGPEEFVIHDETGLLTDAEPVEMADAILRLLGNPKLRQRMGAAAREKVTQDYSLSKATDIFWRAFGEQYGF